MREATTQRNNAEPRPQGRRVRAKLDRPRRYRGLGLWLLPLPTIDPLVVHRSAAARTEYGQDFTYTHCAGSGIRPRSQVPQWVLRC